MLQVEKTTGETPKALLNKPKLHEWLDWYYKAFWDVDPGRRIQQGSVGRIPLTEMVAWLDIHQVLEIETRITFIKTMKALDSVYVRLVNERIEREIAQAKRDAELRSERGRR